MVKVFDSGILVDTLIDELINTEVDIALDIPKTTYIRWLDGLHQLLYSEVIKEQKRIKVEDFDDGIILEDFAVADKENRISFEDVHAVYAVYNDKIIQLVKSTVASGVIFPNTYYKDGNKLCLSLDKSPNEIEIVYFVKPAFHGDTENLNVMLPIEFVDLVAAKLRGEAYKLANEDLIAAKWLNDYNALLETFKSWIASKNTTLGM